MGDHLAPALHGVAIGWLRTMTDVEDGDAFVKKALHGPLVGGQGNLRAEAVVVAPPADS